MMQHVSSYEFFINFKIASLVFQYEIENYMEKIMAF